MRAAGPRATLPGRRLSGGGARERAPRTSRRRLTRWGESRPATLQRAARRAELTGMAISVLEAPRTFGPLPARAADTAVEEIAATREVASRRIPLAVLGAASVGVLQAVALLALALGSLDGVLSSAGPPAGWLVAVALVVLAGWIVLCAGSAAAMVDGTGRSLFVGVAYGELAALAALLVVATATPVANPTPLPLPALALLLLAVPVGKLLLAGTPATQQWIAQGPRARVRRPDPVQAHRLLATVTLGVIGASLCAVAVLAPVPAGDVQDPASSVFTQD
ncbi:hypothetical protein [Blastococcus litoris]|uniref:hypothetical protein n=1 Tax=Blastococcus litoris TaxID=2171622 RepID=UPI0013DFCC98|nr:hypothetical protein [Blastococcus litoris]